MSAGTATDAETEGSSIPEWWTGESAGGDPTWAADDAPDLSCTVGEDCSVAFRPEDLAFSDTLDYPNCSAGQYLGVDSGEYVCIDPVPIVQPHDHLAIWITLLAVTVLAIVNRLTSTFGKA